MGPSSPAARRSPSSRRGQAAGAGLASLLVLGSLTHAGASQAKPNPPKVTANGGLLFQSQGEGSPNTFTGYLFAPLSQGDAGEVLFVDVAANLNLGGALTQQNTVNAGASTRLGYRWLSGDQRWMYGVNAGVDTRQAYAQYAFQAGVGAEALNRNVELRANGYIPFSNQAERYTSGWSNGVLVNNRLIVDGWNRYVVSLSGLNLEAGLPVARWSQNKDSLWLYASYYYLGGDYIAGSSGVRGRAEMRVGSQLSLGATVSYDNLYQLQATGYIRYGAKPLSAQAKDAIANAEREFLALRGLPMQREVNIRMATAQQNLPGSIAINPVTGNALVVRCTGSTSGTAAGTVNCAYASASALLAAAGSGDALLLGGGANLDLAGQARDSQGRPTLGLQAGTTLSSSGNAPTLMTQFGPADLNPIVGRTLGAQPTFSNGVISIGSNTTISGISFSNASITNTNTSTSNVLISDNTFTGSYSPTPGLNTYNENALPTIALAGVSNTTISNNSFTNPNVQSYKSSDGRDDKDTTDLPICNGGICLSGNAIRIGPNASGMASAELSISNNAIEGALDEAIRLDNVNGSILINNNRISGTRMGPDSNMQAAIFVRQWSGNAAVNVNNNLIIANQANRNEIAAKSEVSSGTFALATSGQDITNVVDPLEIGLCRGDRTFSNRAGDKYGDDVGGFNCMQASPATMLYSAQGNVLQPSQNSTSYDEDGIDFNVGSFGIFSAKVNGNNVTIKSNRNNGLTTDFRGYNNITLDISGNTFSSTNDPISIQAGTLNGFTSYAGSGGLVNIGANQLTNTTSSSNLIELESVARNPQSAYSTTPPITPIFKVTTDPSYKSSEIDFSETNFSKSNPENAKFNDYPLFYLNGRLLN
ncbi:MAG: hypothetical protein EBZ51_08935 [Synechococcaceae bacterium WB9_2_112]|nr:hypothetical protein [Synechococcaceae bacterium WB9_2_112]